MWSTRETEPAQLRPEKCTQPRASVRQFPCSATWSLSSVDWETTHTMSRGKSIAAQTLQANTTGVCGEYSQCVDHTEFAPTHGICFMGLHCSGSRVLCRALSKMGPAFCALSRSKLLRFSGTSQGHRLGWACVLCPFQVRAAPATRCLLSTLPQVDHAS